MPAKIVDISDSTISLKILSGETVDLKASESCISRTNLENVLSYAGHMLYIATEKADRASENLWNARLGIHHGTQIRTQEALTTIKKTSETANADKEKLRGIFADLGILRNFQELHT